VFRYLSGGIWTLHLCGIQRHYPKALPAGSAWEFPFELDVCSEDVERAGEPERPNERSRSGSHSASIFMSGIIWHRLVD